MSPFLLISLIVFFNVKSNNQIFDDDLFSLMLEVIRLVEFVFYFSLFFNFLKGCL